MTVMPCYTLIGTINKDELVHHTDSYSCFKELRKSSSRCVCLFSIRINAPLQPLQIAQTSNGGIVILTR